MSNSLRKLLKRTKEIFGKKKQPLPGRTFVRRQGCFNCTGFCNEGPLFDQHKITTAMRDVRVYVSEQGLSPQAAAIRVGLRDRNLTEKKAGMCLRGNAQGDFVVPKYLCDKWVGKIGVDRFGGGVDDLPNELKDKLGDPSVVVEGKHVLKDAAGTILVAERSPIIVLDRSVAPASVTDPKAAEVSGKGDKPS